MVINIFFLILSEQDNINIINETIIDDSISYNNKNNQDIAPVSNSFYNINSQDKLNDQSFWDLLPRNRAQTNINPNPTNDIDFNIPFGGNKNILDFNFEINTNNKNNNFEIGDDSKNQNNFGNNNFNSNINNFSNPPISSNNFNLINPNRNTLNYNNTNYSNATKIEDISKKTHSLDFNFVNLIQNEKIFEDDFDPINVKKQIRGAIIVNIIFFNYKGKRIYFK